MVLGYQYVLETDEPILIYIQVIVHSLWILIIYVSENITNYFSKIYLVPVLHQITKSEFLKWHVRRPINFRIIIIVVMVGEKQYILF